jgi:transposase
MQNYSTIIGVLDMREKNFSYRDCRARYNIGQGTVKLIIDRFNELGLPLNDLRQMQPEKVENTFYPPENIRRIEVPLPDFQMVYDRLMMKGSKLNLFYLWVECKRDHPNGYQYTQYVHYFHEFMRKNYGSKELSMPVERVPGEKVYIDWVGDQPELLVDVDSGELHKIHVFVTTIGVSNCIYAEIFSDEKIDSFMAGTIHALEYYQAIPKYLVPDNCKTAVIKHTRDELIVNASFQDIENFYDVIILPPPARKPKGKPTVEKYVQYLETWLLEKLKENIYPNLEAINRKTKEIIEAINAEIPSGWQYSRMETFQRYDKPQMKTLSDGSFILCDYKTFQRIPNNYHLLYDGHYYSVLYTYYNQPAILKATPTEIKICDKNNRLICTHKRIYNPFPKYITDESHMPPNHVFYKEINNKDGDYYRNRAKAFGTYMFKLIDTILHSSKHEEQAYNSCNGILHCCDGISKVIAEEAARKCVEFNTCQYSYFKRVLTDMLNNKSPGSDKLPTHKNIRGKDFYR